MDALAVTFAGTPMSDHLAPIPWLDVLLIFALICLNGVLAMGELAIVSSREARLKAMAKSGSTRCGSAHSISPPIRADSFRRCKAASH